MNREQLQQAALLGALIAPLAVASCADGPAAPDEPIVPHFAATSNPTADALSALMDQINVALADQGADHRVAVAEYITGGDEAGATVIQKDVGNKQLVHDFVPFDDRRTWSGVPVGGEDDITYAIDMTGDAVPPFGGLSGAQTTAAIQAAMATWEGVQCSTLPITQNPDFGIDLGVIAFLNGLGGSGAIVADVQHAGWRDINFAGGVLGVTFTFIFIDVNGAPTDIDNNGRVDTAFREIYYDPSWLWQIGADIDVESIALHEAGHALSQAHFGNIFIKNNGTVKAAPRAVMNAFYFEPQTSLFGTDNGGHCSNWAQWPNN